MGGALSKLTEGRRAGPRQAQQIQQHRSQLEAYEALCQELGAAPADIAVA